MGFVDSGRGGQLSTASSFWGRVGYAYVPLERSYHHWGGCSRTISFRTRPSSPQGRGERSGRDRALEGQQLGLNELKARLDQSDRAAAMQALELALSELGDGVTLVWRRPERELVGRIKPVSAFRDDQGRVCRHVVYSLALGTYQRQIEGVACRESDGSWSLSG